MQNMADTFYATLRDRLASVNAGRVVAVRGQLRPAVVVDENEMPEQATDAGVFHLRWGARRTDRGGALPMVTAECVITFRSSGADAQSILARGRQRNAMCAELDAMLLPAMAVKKAFSGSGAVAMATNIFWCEQGERVVKEKGELLETTATVLVMSYLEEGER
ncbi:MAG: hypothetical protein JSS87_01850 [Acidobacteria bacterium]|nr:hypothetical protein [Acidobacteriota bacterium]